MMGLCTLFIRTRGLGKHLVLGAREASGGERGWKASRRLRRRTTKRHRVVEDEGKTQRWMDEQRPPHTVDRVGRVQRGMR